MAHNTEMTVVRERIEAIAGFYHDKGRMPSISEIAELVGFKSKNAAHKLVTRLVDLNILERDPKGRLVPKSIAAPVRMLGTVEAGFPSPAEEELADNLSLNDLLVRNPQATFMLKVSGESMSGAGILPGDMVIVDRGQPSKSGDIVIAEVDGDWTMKYLEKHGEQITLVPANPAFSPIRPKKELKIAGVVTAVIRKYQ